MATDGGIDYTISGTSLSITAAANPQSGFTTGEMRDYDSTDPPWKDSGVTSVQIANGVWKIGNRAFMDAGLKGSFTLPRSIRVIGNYAFANNQFTSLSYLWIPPSVSSVGTFAFRNAGRFTMLNWESNLADIPTGCFMYCNFTDGITIPNGIRSIGDSAFQGCTAPGTLTIPDSVVSIGSAAFEQIADLYGELVIGRSVASIGSVAFLQTPDISAIKFMGAKPTIGEMAFMLNTVSPARTYTVTSEWAKSTADFPEYAQTKWEFVYPIMAPGTAYVNDNGTWKQGTPYIKTDSGWVQGVPHIYKSPINNQEAR